MTSLYNSLIDSLNFPFPQSQEAAEKKSSYHIFTERHLQAMWLEQKYFRTLKTSHDQTIEVLSPGIWNSEAGPDFLKAHLKINGQELRGDIEIHLSQEGWYHHQHHTDANYNRVILHVCYWTPPVEKTILTHSGQSVLQAFIKDSLTIPEVRILKLIDLDLYPYKIFSGSGNCSKTLFNTLPQEKTVELLQSAAKWRLKQKKERLEEKIGDLPKSLMGGIAMTLGYKHNAESFFAIYHYLISKDIKEEEVVFSLALAISGFFSSHFQKKWQESEYYQHLLAEFTSQERQIPSFTLKLDGIRPANHPVRRLALLTKMINCPFVDHLEEQLLSHWNSLWKVSSKQNWKRMKDSLLQLIPSYSDPYWEFHYTFEKRKQMKPLALIGTDLKKEILINVCMPFLYSEIEKKGDQKESSAFADFYRSIPSSKTKKSLYLNHRFFGNQKKKFPFRSADLQQGAYQIHRDFCIHFEASCHGCPFVEKYKRICS